MFVGAAVGKGAGAVRARRCCVGEESGEGASIATVEGEVGISDCSDRSGIGRMQHSRDEKWP
mgnify:FL=1